MVSEVSSAGRAGVTDQTGRQRLLWARAKKMHHWSLKMNAIPAGVSLTEGLPEPALGRGTAAPRMSGTGVPYRLPVYISCAVLALVTNYLLGKEMAFDLLNYHLYAGFGAVNDRFGQDYFAAGPQSYFNPYAYVPFYALVSTGLPALAIGSLLAVAHSIILWLTFELAIAVCPSEDSRTRVATGICAVALAYMNPILMQQIGSSFADIMTAELVLAGWVLLAGAVRSPRAAPVISAGLIVGAACALKLTNTVHAIAGFAVLIMLPLSLRGRLRHSLFYGISLVIGLGIFAAPWSYRLERMFGNPVFPLMNSVFRSPEFTTEPLRHFRFIPDTFAEAVWRPFAMLDPMPMVHEELRSPDLRYAVLVVLLTVLLLHWLWRRIASRSTQSTHAKFAISTRMVAALGCGLGADWVLWLSGSGNSRYFLPMACVAAVVIVGLLFRLFATRPKVRNYILAAIFAIQAVQLWMGTQYRWHEVPWGGPWFNIAVPETLRTEPSLYLTVGMESNSFVAPYLARGAGLINVSGDYTLGPTGANGDRVSALIGRYAPHVRVLIRGAKLYQDEEKGEPRRAQVDFALERFHLRVDTSDCETITMKDPSPEPILVLETSAPVAQTLGDTLYLVSCHLIPDSADHSAQIAQQLAADVVLDRLEDACPKLFQPRRPLSEHRGRAWARYYSNTDLSAWVSDGWVKFYQSQRGIFRKLVGRESDWARAPLRIACGRQSGIYFAKVLDSNEGP
jgi:Glycosyltransferase family 87